MVELNKNEKKFLRQVWNFQRARKFRYGLNIKYVKVENKENVLEKLIEKKLVWVFKKYGHRYIFLTKKGREVVEKMLRKKSGGKKRRKPEIPEWAIDTDPASDEQWARAFGFYSPDMEYYPW